MSARFGNVIRPLVQSATAVAIGLIAGALLMLVFRLNPFLAYFALFRGAFASPSGFVESLAFATPLIVTAITFSVGARAGLFNIGAEGQAFIGAIGAVIVGGTIALPSGLHIAAATAFGMLLGAAWAVPAAFLKMWRGVHEVVSTIMLNWIAFWFVTYLIRFHFGEPGRAERATPALATARYPVLGETLTAVIIVVVGFAAVVTILLWRTTLGYELRLVGNNPDAAKYAGISIPKAILASFILGGLAAGLAGASQVLGRPPSWTIYATLGNIANLGYQGIGVALIGRNHPIGGIFAAVFYGGLTHGGRFMEYEAGVSSELVGAINGIIVIALAVPEVLTIIRSRQS